MAEKPTKSNQIVRKATNLKHIFLIDWDDTGIVREVAVVAEMPDGTINGVFQVNMLINIRFGSYYHNRGCLMA
jgi:hypothetical protein